MHWEKLTGINMDTAIYNLYLGNMHVQINVMTTVNANICIAFSVSYVGSTGGDLPYPGGWAEHHGPARSWYSPGFLWLLHNVALSLPPEMHVSALIQFTDEPQTLNTLIQFTDYHTSTYWYNSLTNHTIQCSLSFLKYVSIHWYSSLTTTQSAHWYSSLTTTQANTATSSWNTCQHTDTVHWLPHSCTLKQFTTTQANTAASFWNTCQHTNTVHWLPHSCTLIQFTDYHTGQPCLSLVKQLSTHSYVTPS